jgi:hypothetical protein
MSGEWQQVQEQVYAKRERLCIYVAMAIEDL